MRQLSLLAEMKVRRDGGAMAGLKLAALVLLLVCAQTLPVSADGASAPLTSAEPTVTPLVAEGELAGWYQAQTGYATTDYTGVYKIVPVGDALYLGLGTARPAEADGALLARLDAGGLTALRSLDEQGFVDMTLVDGRIYIPGADPMDDWSAGNLYVHDLATGETAKQRTLPNAIHAWQVRSADGRLLVAVGRYLPELGDWPYAGGILASADGGLTWTADDSRALGAHRTYDLVLGRGMDVALVDDADVSGCQLATRVDGGEWQRSQAWVLCRLRLCASSAGGGDPKNRAVLALSQDTRSLVVAGSERIIPLPFAVEPWAYNWSAYAGRTLHVATADGRIMATQDLRTWREVAALGRTIVSLAYWPERGALVVATRGPAAGLWTVPVTGD